MRSGSGRSGDREESDGGEEGRAGTDGNGEGNRAVTDGSGGGERVATDGGVTEGRGERSRLARTFGRDFLESAPFWLPTFLLMAFFVYGTIGWNVLISLTDFSEFGSPDYSNLDFDMYVRAAGDPYVIEAAVNTFVLLVAFTLVALAIGLLVAILVDRGIRFENTFRTIYLLPMSLSFVVTAQFWLWMYDFDSGIVNATLGVVGLGPYNWIGNSSLVLWAVVFALVWQFSGYTMVVYLAALRAIPDEHFEAAKVDGASVPRMYWRVIVPQLKNATLSATVVLMVFALKAFDFLYALVGGYRPPNGADILATKMVREAYSNTNWAYGAAIAVILFAMALAVVAPYLYYQYKHDNL
ncbi:carbohydrate ABC transporter permease [Halorarum salinum]|uniref:Sugar ABC transporter permease n=1 Tax=Halorarum salinum TaxID=2743089 RepID=A0A7D5QDX1_9EURY|nr:sugar ABC transporter permease [Halobaculum salinum]QLG62461.1 sugar ABC transporter permease [Halobaculum salinum]